MNDVLRDAYSVLRRVTPLPRGLDCGKLCVARCCKGTDNDGMELFHGEEALFAHDARFTVRADGERNILVCRGTCTRRSRPLACRMYPFYPVPTDTPNGLSMRVVYDPRGLHACPIVREHIKPDPRFVRAVRLAGMILARDPQNLRLLRETGALFDDMLSLTAILSGKDETK